MHGLAGKLCGDKLSMDLTLNKPLSQEQQVAVSETGQEAYADKLITICYLALLFSFVFCMTTILAASTWL